MRNAFSRHDAAAIACCFAVLGSSASAQPTLPRPDPKPSPAPNNPANLEVKQIPRGQNSGTPATSNSVPLGTTSVPGYRAKRAELRGLPPAPGASEPQGTPSAPDGIDDSAAARAAQRPGGSTPGSAARTATRDTSPPPRRGASSPSR